MSSTAEQLRSYVVTEFLDGEDTEELTGDYDLIDSGVIDSLGLVRVISHIAQTYDIPVDDVPFALDNFRTLDLMCAFVDETRATAAAAA